MAEELIDKYVDRTGFAQDTQFVLGELNKVHSAFKELENIKIKLSTSSGMAELIDLSKKATAELTKVTDASDRLALDIIENNKKVVDASKKQAEANKQVSDSYKDLLAASVKNDLAQKQLAESKKKLNDAFKAGAISQQEYEKQLVDIKEAETALKVSSLELNRAIRNMEKEFQSADESLNKLRAQLALAQQAFDKLTKEERQSEFGIELSKKIGTLGKEVNELEQGTGRFGRNVGNYANSLAGGFQQVADEVSRLKQRLSDLNQEQSSNPAGFAARGGDVEIRKVTDALDELNRVQSVGLKTNQSFNTTVRQLEREYQNLATSGNVSNEFLEEFKKFVAEAKDQAGDLRAEIKALASDTRTFDLLSGSVNTLVSAFQAAEGVAALLGTSEEEVQQITLRMTAVQNVATGVREIANEVTTKGTAANKAYAFVQGLVATATDKSATASKRLTAALGLIGIAVTVIGAVVLALSAMNRSMSEAAEKRRILNDIQKKAIEDYSKEVTRLELLKKVLLDTSVGIDKKKIALSEYNKVADKSNKLDEKSLSNASLIEASINRQISLIQKRGLAKAAENVIAEKSEKLFLKQLELEEKFPQFSEDRIKTLTDQAKKLIQERGKLAGINDAAVREIIAFSDIPDEQLKKFSEKNTKLSVLLDGSVKGIVANIKRQLDQIGQARKGELSGSGLIAPLIIEIDQLKADLQRTTEVGFGFIADVGGQFDTDNKETAKSATDNVRKIQAEIRRALFEAAQQTAQDQITIAQSVLDNDKKSYEERLTASQVFYDKSLALIKTNREFQLNELKIGTKEAIADVIKRGKEEGITEQKVQKEVNAIREKAKADALLIEAKFNSEVLQLDSTSTQQRIELRESEAAAVANHRQSLHEQELQDIQNQYDRELLKLERKFEKGRISEEKYNKKKLLLQANLQAALLREDIAFTKAEIALAEARAAASGKQEDIDAVITGKQKLAALEIKLQETVFTFTKNKSKETLKDIEEFLTKVASIASAVEDIIGDFLGALAEREKNRIQEQIDLLEEKKQKDIEAANATISNVKDREAAIAIIETRAQVQREALERRQRQADERRARFEKAATIAKIVIETALAVVHQLGTGDPATAIARAIAAGALGAAQLAVAIATPIPKYKEGKGPGDKYEGLAIWGEGGKRELMIREDGTTELSPNRAALTYVGKNDQILPDAEQAFSMGLSSMGRMHDNIKAGMAVTGSGSLIDYERLDKSFNKGFEKLNRTIQNKKEYHFNPPSLSDRFNRVIDGNKEYYNQNGFTNW